MPLKIYIDIHVFSNTLRLIVVVYLMDTLYVHVYFKYGSLYELVYTIISCFLVTFVVVQYGAPGLFGVFLCFFSLGKISVTLWYRYACKYLQSFTLG